MMPGRLIPKHGSKIGSIYQAENKSVYCTITENATGIIEYSVCLHTYSILLTIINQSGLNWLIYKLQVNLTWLLGIDFCIL